MTNSIEDKYRSKTPREHIISRPGNYIGQMECGEAVEEYIPVTSEGITVMSKAMVSYSPAFIKIFDEILTNSIDHSIREKNVTTIKVDIDQESNTISVYNDGPGIEVQMHPQAKMYIPQFIFSEVYTSSNYDDTKEREWAGTNGVGSKCISDDTKVPLFSGEIKLAKDIKVGDKLIGDDGYKRIVLNKLEGQGEMYKITQHLGEEYTVNDNHTLTLHMSDHKVIFWNGDGWSMLWWNDKESAIKTKHIKAINNSTICEECGIELNSSVKRHYSRMHKNKEIPINIRKSPSYGDMTNEKVKEKYIEMQIFANSVKETGTFDINIQDYLNLNPTTQRRLAGVRGNCVNWDHKDVILDPYVLGLWLGDGMKHGYSYACDGDNDYQIIDYLEEWCKNNDSNFRKGSHYTYRFSSISDYGGKKCAPLRKLLKEYNLINNKHIPKEYLVNSRDVRLKVLAGIIDTDGHVSRDGSRVTISQTWKHKALVEDIVYLVRSLGFCCSTAYREVTYTMDSGEKRVTYAYTMNISGNLDDIPTTLPRKKCSTTKKINTDKTTGYLKVEKVGVGKYVGLQIDGNNRFLINDFTVTHNCTCFLATKFSVETVDQKTKLKYTQNFYDGAKRIEEPVIKPCKSKSYTKITFTPNLKPFGLIALDNDNLHMLQKRVYEAAAILGKTIKLYYNEKIIKTGGISSYAELFPLEKPYIQDSLESGELILMRSPDNVFSQVSFVNGIPTSQGGKHVEYITNQLVKRCKESFKKKYKELDFTSASIKNKMFLFLTCKIPNPVFNSQTKEYLSTPSSKFSSKLIISDKTINAFTKLVGEELAELAKMNDEKKLNKEVSNTSKRSVKVPKLDDAHYAGTSKSQKCSLLLSEGDSARTAIIAGLNSKDKDYIGTFPLRGKGLNVQKATKKQLENNEEIKNMMKILGLQKGMVYKDTSTLRYGGIYIVCDQDSVAGNTPLLIRSPDDKGNMKLKLTNIQDLSITNFSYIFDREYGTFDENTEVWTESGWTKIVHLMRHKVTKQMFRVVTNTGVVDVTKDHSLLNKFGEKISPMDCKVGTQLLHSFPREHELNNENYDNINCDVAYEAGYYWDESPVDIEILNSSKCTRENFLNGLKSKYSYRETFSYSGKNILAVQSLYILCKSLLYTVYIDFNEIDDLYVINVSDTYGIVDPLVIKKIIPLHLIEEYVYDLETENHHYAAGLGQLVVHNTDGFHCKMLIVNFFRAWFPELLKLNYLKSTKTPIVKVFKGTSKVGSSFYNLQDYEEWKINNTEKHIVKYKKGLGSLTNADAKECFYSLKDTELQMTYDSSSIQDIDLAFNGDLISKRKEWLSVYDPNNVVDYKMNNVSYSDLIHKELKHFSVYDNLRSIPHLVDGLKPSQRKVLYSCFKRKLTSTIRVSQLAGYVSEQAEYHHGEAALQETIISMAQDFIGSNNINLLFPEDQFGSRLTSNDASSPRYIHTCLSKVTSTLFPQLDNPLLNYLKGDEGDLIEPEYYYPIIPMILVNGSKGIGSGYSTDIPSYNPKDLILLIKDLLQGKQLSKNLIPWYKNFKGSIVMDQKGERAYCYGKYELSGNNKVIITELPIKKWTEKYYDSLDNLESAGLIKSYKKNCSGDTIHFELTFSDPSTLKKLHEADILYDQLDLCTKISFTNMHAFVPNSEGKSEMKLFKSPEDILKTFYNFRLNLYTSRKLYLKEKLEGEISTISEKIRFIKGYINGDININNVSEIEIISQLISLKFAKIENSYNYLLDTPLKSLTKERMNKLSSQLEDLIGKLKLNNNTSAENMWLQELQQLESYLK